MLRRVLKKKWFQDADVRNTNRNDQSHFEGLVENGWYEVTQRGRDDADLGFDEPSEHTRNAPTGPVAKAGFPVPCHGRRPASGIRVAPTVAGRDPIHRRRNCHDR
jgi:hypothetical protein